MFSDICIATGADFLDIPVSLSLCCTSSTRLINAFYYMKNNSLVRNSVDFHGTTSWGRHFSIVKNDINWLADQMDELRVPWRDRFSVANRLPHAFGARVTASIDTFPIYICKPSSPILDRLVFNGKYGGHVLKVSNSLLLVLMKLLFLENIHIQSELASVHHYHTALANVFPGPSCR
jgi:hypothetical protein